MLGSLLPARVDNTFRGRTAALWLLALVALVKILQSAAEQADGCAIAQSAD